MGRCCSGVRGAGGLVVDVEAAVIQQKVVSCHGDVVAATEVHRTAHNGRLWTREGAAAEQLRDGGMGSEWSEAEEEEERG